MRAIHPPAECAAMETVGAVGVPGKVQEEETEACNSNRALSMRSRYHEKSAPAKQGHQSRGEMGTMAVVNPLR